MPRQDHIPAGDPCWVELVTSDLAATLAFYEAVLGWTYDDKGEEYGGYVTALADGATVAGIMPRTPEMPPGDEWSLYLATDDVDASAAAAAAAGAQVVVPPMQVMELGSMSVFVDPGGAMIGVWQPAEHHGFDVVAEPGAPAWFELHTADHAASEKFYETVFGWDMHRMSDTDEFRYSTHGLEDDAKAGIMQAIDDTLPEGVGGEWSVYFQVTDADAAVATAEKLGGTIVMAPEDTPFGRLAVVKDATGASFRLVAS